jgi:hypothetical protein
MRCFTMAVLISLTLEVLQASASLGPGDRVMSMPMLNVDPVAKGPTVVFVNKGGPDNPKEIHIRDGGQEGCDRAEEVTTQIVGDSLAIACNGRGGFCFQWRFAKERNSAFGSWYGASCSGSDGERIQVNF